MAEPRVELPVLDVELGGQGALVDVLGGPAQVGVDAVVGDAAAQLGAVDDRGHVPVCALGHQDGAGKAPQGLFGGGGPLLLAGAHLQQLGGEGQLGGGDSHLGGDVVAQRHVLGVQVGGASGEGLQLLAGVLEGRREVAHRGLGVPAGGIGVLLLGLELLAAGGDLPLEGEEHVLTDGGAQLHRGQLGGELGAALAAPFPLHLQTGDLLLPVVDLAAPGPLALLLELGEVGAGLGDVLREAALLGAEPVALELEALLLIPQQAHQVLGGVHVDVGAAVHQFAAAGAHGGPCLVVLPQPAQQVALLTGGHQRLVHLGEVVEVRQRLIGQLEGAGGIQHVVAQQGVDVTEFLGGLDLVQQPQGLLVGDAQQLAERGAVLAELAEGLGAGVGCLQGLALDLGGDELAQVAHVQGRTGDDVQALDVRVGGVPGVQQQQAGQLHGAALAVGVAQRDHGQGGLLAQHLLAELTGGLVVVHGPCAAHVAGHRAAVLGAGRARIGGGGVELQGARRREQGADGVQERGLAGAGATGEEEALGGDRQVVGAVEGAPVGDLDVGEAPLAGVRVLGVRCDGVVGAFGGGHAGQVEGVGCGCHLDRVPGWGGRGGVS